MKESLNVELRPKLEPAGQATNTILNVVDRPGVIPVVEMRGFFEGAVTGTPKLRHYPLVTVESEGRFLHYADPETDQLWLGFALGMRMSQRLTASSPKLSEF